MRPKLRRGAIALFIASVTAISWLFIYNSGYGYDALEYLVIGRSLNDGYPLYAFVPSKSWAVYVLLAAYLRLPGTAGHLGVSLLVTMSLFTACLMTYLVLRRRFEETAAVIAAILVGVGGLFMELNYLEPEPFVFIAGLVAFSILASTRGRIRWSSWLVAGVALGIGMAFKTVAGFYALAFLMWALADPQLRRESTPRNTILRVSAFASGLAFAVVVPGVWFWLTGRLAQYVEWSFVFPLFRYPANTEFAIRTLTKLAWIWLLISGALVLSLRPSVRREVYRDESVRLLLLLGVAGLLPLWKTQASHYAFPGAAFLLMFGAVVAARMRGAEWSPYSVLGPAVMAGVVVAISGGLASRPGVLKRLTMVESFHEEDVAKSTVQSLVKPDQYAIFLTASPRHYWLYWVTDRYPNWEVVNTEVQTTYLVKTRGADLLRAFDDPKLALVEFDPAWPSFNDAGFLDSPEARQFVSLMSCRLREEFVRRDDLHPSMVLWLRRATTDDAPGSGCEG